MQLRVMTYNIQHGILHLKAKEKRQAYEALPEEEKQKIKQEIQEKRIRGESTEDLSLIDLGAMAEAIRPFHPDILCLNEMRDKADFPGFEAQTRIIADSLGMPFFFFARAIDIGGQGPYGNALLSRYPFVSAERVMIPDPEVQDEDTYYETRCLIKARVEIPVPNSALPGAAPGIRPGREYTTLHVLSTHFGLAREEARNAAKTVLENTDAALPTILMGDFNLTPDSPILQSLFEKYNDSGEKMDPVLPTHPSDAPEIKIDYVMATPPVTFINATVPPLVVSDHRPVVCTIEF